MRMIYLTADIPYWFKSIFQPEQQQQQNVEYSIYNVIEIRTIFSWLHTTRLYGKWILLNVLIKICQ